MPNKILVVEDELIIALDLERSLKRLGYEVAITDCCDGALHAIARDRPDIISMDIKIRGNVDGIAAGARIKMEFGFQSCL